MRHASSQTFIYDKEQIHAIMNFNIRYSPLLFTVLKLLIFSVSKYLSPTTIAYPNGIKNKKQCFTVTYHVKVYSIARCQITKKS